MSTTTEKRSMVAIVRKPNPPKVVPNYDWRKLTPQQRVAVVRAELGIGGER